MKRCCIKVRQDFLVCLKYSLVDQGGRSDSSTCVPFSHFKEINVSVLVASILILAMK